MSQRNADRHRATPKGGCHFMLTQVQSKTQLVMCGQPATAHMVGEGQMPRGIDAQGTVIVKYEGDYCQRHVRTMRNRSTYSKESPPSVPQTQ